MKRENRKPRPQPPRWYWLSTDDCWDCKNRRGCNGCKRLKIYGKKYHDKKNKEKLKELLEKN